jgi:hypothetical protein
LYTLDDQKDGTELQESCQYDYAVARRVYLQSYTPE